jgi:hypothetical protein
VVVRTDTDVSRLVIHQWMTFCIRMTRMTGTGVGRVVHTLQMQHFGETRDRQIIEVDGILPHCDQCRSRRAMQLIKIDLKGIGMVMEDGGSIEVSISSLLLIDRRM